MSSSGRDTFLLSASCQQALERFRTSSMLASRKCSSTGPASENLGSSNASWKRIHPSVDLCHQTPSPNSKKCPFRWRCAWYLHFFTNSTVYVVPLKGGRFSADWAILEVAFSKFNKGLFVVLFLWHWRHFNTAGSTLSGLQSVHLAAASAPLKILSSLSALADLLQTS